MRTKTIRHICTFGAMTLSANSAQAQRLPADSTLAAIRTAAVKCRSTAALRTIGDTVVIVVTDSTLDARNLNREMLVLCSGGTPSATPDDFGATLLRALRAWLASDIEVPAVLELRGPGSSATARMYYPPGPAREASIRPLEAALRHA
jgi:hypothetical protein